MGKLPPLALIGLGNMGEALLRGLLESGLLSAADVKAAEKSPRRAEEVAARFGLAVTPSIREACEGVRLVVLAVKPQDADEALAELARCPGDRLLVSICAGLTLDRLASQLPKGAQVVRVMPNAPALVGCGASVYCAGANATPEAKAWVEALLGAVGEVHAVDRESLLDAVTGLSGSGPAYVYAFLEALADGGVLMGLPRELARALAGQTVLGAARMAAESGLHPAELRDRVASPGGTTTAGLRELELRGFRGAVIEAVRAGTVRSRELGS
jgi:pyrroline-5-carboxylate reductase